MNEPKRALAGIRIVECAQDIAAPYAAMLLAEQGAEVIKVEPPGGDRARALPGFHVWNRSKRSARADLATEAGREKLRSLCRAADVLVTDWVPGQPALSEAELAEANPDLIHCWMPPYGACGDAADQPPVDDLVAARSGLLASQWAYREGPTFLVIPIASYGAAMLAAGAVCAALVERRRSGRGQRLVVSWLAGAFAMQTGSVVDHPVIQRVMTMQRDPLGPIPVYRLFKASDDWLFIACGNPTFWNKLCLLLERPELVSDERFDGAPWAIAPAHWDELKSVIQGIVATHPQEEWLRRLAEADIPCAPVLSRAEFLRDPQIHHLGMRQEIDDPELGRTIQMGVPVDLRATPGAIQCPAPKLGDGGEVVPWEITPRRESVGAHRTSGGPLAGTVVLDFTSYIAGPAAGVALALAGADVIKVESPSGDPFRAFAFGFYGWNQGKRGLALDFSKPGARQVVDDLTRKADVLVENLRPGATRRLGIDYERLANLNPRLVYGSITAFGSSGPRGNEAGFDPLLQSRSGLMRAQGGHGHDPVYLTCGVCDYAAGLLCAFGIEAALFARERTGRGQHVETSLAQAAMAVQSGEFIFYDGRPDMENGGPDLLGRHPLQRAYACHDGWIFVSAGVERWCEVSKMFGGEAETPPSLSPDESADGPAGQWLARNLGGRTRGEVLGRLAAAGIPAAPILGIPELFQDAHIAGNDLLYDATAPSWGEFRQTGTLVKYDRTPVRIARAAPQRGEHGEEILRTLLGYSQQRLAVLRASGVIPG